MNAKQIGLAVIGVGVAVIIGLMVLRQPDAGVEIVQAPASGPGPGDPFESHQPAPLQLGGSGPEGAAETADGAPRGADAGSRGDMNQHRQAYRPRLGGTSPRHGLEGEESDAAGGSEVRSGLADPERLADTTARAAAQANAAARAPIDDWPVDDSQLVDSGEPRQPEEGEVLSLFDGDPITAQAEAAIEKGVTFDEEGARFSDESEYAVPMAGRMSGETGTLSFWVRPDGETSDVNNASLVQLRSQNEWSNRLQIWKDGGNVRMVFADGNGNESGTTYGSDGWPTDEWRQVTATWGEGMTALYVNGLLAGTSQYEGGFKILPGTLLHVGSNYKDDPRSLTGAVNQFRVYDRPLTPEEVSKLTSDYPE